MCVTGKTGTVSKAINLAINNPILWGFMKAGARNTMIKTAEGAGIPWRSAVEELKNTSEVSCKCNLSGAFTVIVPNCTGLHLDR